MSFFCVMADLEAKKYWVALNMVPGVGSVTYQKLLNVFHDPEHVFSAPFSAFQHIPGMQEKVARAIVNFGFPDHVKQELDHIARHQVNLVTWNDDAYPQALKTIFDPPPVLYIKGNPIKQHDVMIAIVGARKATTYGRTIAGQLSREFALKDVTVISGMARGIDSAAHWGTLKAGGRTIAVLGCGVNVIYPPENDRLYHTILEKGTILSEFPMFAKPDRGNFPARNRIISGMSLGTIIVEAGIRSGALITADMALDQGRDVFAVPGQINSPSSQGTNRLIKQGAMLIENVDDVLNALSIEISREIQGQQQELVFASPSPPPSLSQDEQKVFTEFSSQPIHIDELIIRTQLPSGTVSAILMMLEMKNVIRQQAGKMFIKI